MNSRIEENSATAQEAGARPCHGYILRQVRIPAVAKSIAFAFFLVASALVLTGCPGTYYERGYGAAYYAPTYGNYYAGYGYNGAPYTYSGVGVHSISVRGVRHRRHYGRHHYYGHRRHYGRAARARGQHGFRGRHR